MSQQTVIGTLALARTVVGGGHLVFPGRLAQHLTPAPISSRARGLIRVLGARQLFQAAVTRARPTRAVLAMGAGVDVLHAISMVALAVRRREWRTPALIDAATAVALAVSGAAAARLAAVPPPAD